MADSIEIFQRERAVEQMILNGMDSRKIIPKITVEFGVEERMARHYIARALERVRRLANIDRPVEIARANSRFNRVYKDSMKVRTVQKPIKLQRFTADGKRTDDTYELIEVEIPPNLTAATNAEKARAELLGLNAPKQVSIEGTVTLQTDEQRRARIAEERAKILAGAVQVEVSEAQFEEIPGDEIDDYIAKSPERTNEDFGEEHKI